MKRKHYILGVLALLCLLSTGYYAWTLYDAHRKWVAEWNEEAKVCFEEALWMEVNKRAEIPVNLSTEKEVGTTMLKERIPDSVSVMTMEGFRKYQIDRNKYEKNLIKDTRKRLVLSSLFSLHPLSVDALALHWDSLLTAKNILVGNRIRYIVTDLNLQNDTVYSEGGNHLSFDSLTVRYLGFRCEHELVAFVSYPDWLSGLSGGERSMLLLPWIIFVLLGFFYAPIESFFRNKFVEKIMVEKEVHVADVAIDKAKIYQLPDGCLFDSFAGTLTKGEHSKQLQPQSVLLLRLFLRKENHRLSSVEIERELWNGKGTIDQLYKAIQRLRGDLKKVSSDVVIKNINGDYELKLPISSNNLLETELDHC